MIFVRKLPVICVVDNCSAYSRINTVVYACDQMSQELFTQNGHCRDQKLFNDFPDASLELQDTFNVVSIYRYKVSHFYTDSVT